MAGILLLFLFLFFVFVVVVFDKHTIAWHLLGNMHPSITICLSLSFSHSFSSHIFIVLYDTSFLSAET